MNFFLLAIFGYSMCATTSVLPGASEPVAMPCILFRDQRKRIICETLHMLPTVLVDVINEYCKAWQKVQQINNFMDLSFIATLMVYKGRDAVIASPCHWDPFSLYLLDSEIGNIVIKEKNFIEGDKGITDIFYLHRKRMLVYTNINTFIGFSSIEEAARGTLLIEKPLEICTSVLWHLAFSPCEEMFAYYQPVKQRICIGSTASLKTTHELGSGDYLMWVRNGGSSFLLTQGKQDKEAVLLWRLNGELPQAEKQVLPGFLKTCRVNGFPQNRHTAMIVTSASGKDDFFALYDVVQRKIIQSFTFPATVKSRNDSSLLHFLTYSPDGSFAVCTSDSTCTPFCCVWDIETGERTDIPLDPKRINLLGARFLSNQLLWISGEAPAKDRSRSLLIYDLR